MKRKELKNLAKKIFTYEKGRTEDPDNIEYYENEILRLTGQVQEFEDIIELDLMIQEMFDKEARVREDVRADVI